ncbi:DUF2167 domain-containing protein [Echinicola sp. CAU 1574]|uniref:DUF2167 domain-containing protein n=1 Tax=Echinicola arenosa TaxID=2774144 RepID=A0ABR9AMM3_9BACT|nr:DUF2167 domain-containing protein [Echinicola arenosa]MBD8489561.1 DUF2167 domain-containing protein [Echinicola arenosa]
MIKKLLVFHLFLIGIIGQIHAQEEELSDEEYFALVDSINSSFTYQYGTIILGDNIATLQVPKGYKYLDTEQSSYVLTELWGNPPEEVLGLLFPEDIDPMSDDFTYAVEINYAEEGYIDDEDAQEIDYDDLLEEMQSDTDEANSYRIEEGYEKIELVGWASEPFYDYKSKKLHWAKELKFGEQEINTLNYNIRILGRKGYLNMNAISNMEALPIVKQDINDILASVEFNDGYRYGDFNPEVDEIAAYGIGGLIAGKMLAKTGFFVLLLKFWKVIALAVGGFFTAFRKKIFGSGE